MKRVMVVAPHPDDESLGCGGTLLKHVAAGDQVYWLIVTEIHSRLGLTPARRERRALEILAVARHYGFVETIELGSPAAYLDEAPLADLVAKVGSAIKRVAPEVLYVPYRGDVHTDHRIVFDAVVACTKWFRYPSVHRLLAYETLSETEFGLDTPAFRPNVFVDVSEHIEGKLAALALFEGEMAAFPFPRSNEAVRALASLRGSTVGCLAAEAFVLLREFS